MTTAESFFLENSSKIISQYRSASLVNGLQQTILEEIFALRSTIESMPFNRSIEFSKGDILNLAGSIYNVKRPAFANDETYRSIILASIAARKSKGKVSDIKSVVNFLLGERDVRVFSYGLNTIKVEIPAPVSDPIKPILLELLSLSISAGKKISILLETQANNFRFGVGWGKSFAKPIRSRSFDRVLRFIVPSSQSPGVFVLAETSGVWSILATGEISKGLENPPNRDGSSTDLQGKSPIGNLLIKRGDDILPYTDNLRIAVRKGELLEFVVSDDSFDDNLGAFEVEIGVISNGR